MVHKMHELLNHRLYLNVPSHGRPRLHRRPITLLSYHFPLFLFHYSFVPLFYMMIGPNPSLVFLACNLLSNKEPNTILPIKNNYYKGFILFPSIRGCFIRLHFLERTKIFLKHFHILLLVRFFFFHPPFVTCCNAEFVGSLQTK